MPADHQLSQANLDNPVEIIICRTFTAPRDLVWLAWTDPNHVGRWWGPAGFTTTTHSMDFRPGGSWRYTMHGPDGRENGSGTKVTMRSIFPTAEARDFVIHDHGAVEGGKQHLANLEDHLASMSG